MKSSRTEGRQHWRMTLVGAVMAVALVIPLGAGGCRPLKRASPAPSSIAQGPDMSSADQRPTDPDGWTRRWSAAPTRVASVVDGVWDPDNEIATGGGTLVTDADAEPQYRYARTGAPSYRIPVPTPGTYAVTVTVASSTATSGPLAFQVEAGAEPARQLHLADSDGVLRRAIFLSQAPEASLHFRITGVDVIVVTVTLALQEVRALSEKFADDFDGRAGTFPDGRWRPQTGATGWGNGELQDYTADAENVSLTGAGQLAIVAHRAPAGREKPGFTSGRLRTAYEGKYGRIEGRIRVPAGAGLLPAFWMLGADVERVGWPQSGEVDLLESLGAADPDRAHGTIHGPDGTPNGWQVGWTARPAGGPASRFHTYSLDWWPGVLQWSVDGVVHGVIERADMTAGRWVFEKPAFLLLSLAVGGRWPGTPPDATSFPQVMEIASVRWLG